MTGISPYPKKAEIIYKIIPPTIIAGVRSLMGMIMYCVNLNFSEVHQPLRELTKKMFNFNGHSSIMIPSKRSRHSHDFFDQNKETLLINGEL